MKTVDVCIITGQAEAGDDTQQCLTQAGLTVVVAGTVDAGAQLIHSRRPRVVLCDEQLPDGTGVDLCQQLHDDLRAPAAYFVLVLDGEATPCALDPLSAGVDDLVARPLTGQALRARVQVGLRMQQLHEQLRTAAITDGLTGLYNHDYITRVLEHELGRSRRYGHPLTLLMIDIDHFKAVNDSFGHLVGNRVLEAISQVLRANVRDVDTVGRFGGEEFSVILPEATCRDARRVAERMRVAIADSLGVEALHSHQVTASFGLADVDDNRVTCAAELVDLADRALYLAKRRGRNQVVVCGEVDDNTDAATVIQTDDVDALRQRVAVLSARAKGVYVQSIASLMQALDERDPYSAHHSTNVAHYAERLAEELACNGSLVASIRNAALLHDVGKVGVPDRILLKRTALNDLERMVMDQVPLIGTRIVDHLRILEAEIQIIRHQREHYDGSGIPAGLKGEQIPVGARILLVADAFDSMTTDRVYRRRQPIDDALCELQKLAGHQFDPRVVRALQAVLERERDAWQRRINASVSLLDLPEPGPPPTPKPAST